MRRSPGSGGSSAPPASSSSSRGGGGGGGGGGTGGLSDLRAHLRSLSNTTRPEAAQTRREVFRRVISYMTVSIDVAPLFSDMLMAAAAAQNDIVLKKMLYLYICTYAATTPDLALLAINTLVKDCTSDDPTIRGLALRALSSIRVPNLLEYLLQPLRNGLSDSNPYVRKAAAMGVLKLHLISPEAVDDNNFDASLYEMLRRDADGGVVGAALNALVEIKGGHAALAQRDVVMGLLGRLRELTEWGQSHVLELAAQYSPENDTERYEMMNIAEDRLTHNSGGVVLAAAKLMLLVTRDAPAVHQKVFERIKSPLLTLLGAATPEGAWAILSQLHMLTLRAPALFSTDFKSFFCRHTDSPNVKALKLDILACIACVENAIEIAAELSEYVADVSPELAQHAVRAIGRIALQLDDSAVSGIGLVERLLTFLDMDRDYITAETLSLLKDLLRRFPSKREELLQVAETLDPTTVSDPSARAALVYVFGEYADEIPDAAYALEPLLLNFEEESVAPVRLELLTAGMKLLFRAPAQAQKMLGKALAAGLQDTNQDVHDRALLYYRLLCSGVESAEKVVCSPKDAITDWNMAINGEGSGSEPWQDRLFSEFNSLSVIYKRPASSYVDEETFGAPPAGGAGGRGLESQASQVQSVGDDDEDNMALMPQDGGVGGGSKPTDMNGGGGGGSGGGASAPQDDLLGLIGDETPVNSPSVAGGGNMIDDLLGFGSSPSSPPAQPQPPAAPVLQVNVAFRMDPPSFQASWGSFSASFKEYCALRAGADLSSPAPLIAHLAPQPSGSFGLQCMASGGQGGALKLYLYTQDATSGAVYLVEMITSSGPSGAGADLTVKCESGGEAAALFIASVKQRLEAF